MVIETTMHGLSAVFDIADNEDSLTIIMFYGATCGPCKATMPFYEEVAKHFVDELGAKIYFYKINAWEPAEQMEYCKTNWNINGVPQFKAIYKGQVVLDRAGGGDYSMLHTLFSQAIDNAFRIHGVKI